MLTRLNGSPPCFAPLYDPDLLVRQASLPPWPLHRLEVAIRIASVPDVMNDNPVLLRVHGVYHAIVADTDSVQALRPCQLPWPLWERVLAQAVRSVKDWPDHRLGQLSQVPSRPMVSGRRYSPAFFSSRRFISQRSIGSSSRRSATTAKSCRSISLPRRSCRLLNRQGRRSAAGGMQRTQRNSLQVIKRLPNLSPSTMLLVQGDKPRGREDWPPRGPSSLESAGKCTGHLKFARERVSDVEKRRVVQTRMNTRFTRIFSEIRNTRYEIRPRNR